MVAPAVPLYDFQTRWFLDCARFKIGKMSRQIGKSFIVALEAVDDAMETGDDWVLLSTGERQSKELMVKVKMHCTAYSIAASNIEQTIYTGKDDRYTLLTITLANGARIMGLPANPDTARGFSANIILDEFAMHKDSDRIWTALFPTISRGYKIRIVSTPQGLSNRFHTLFVGENNWSKHDIDIHQAVADGVPFDIAELKEGLDDEDAWQQEYLVKFIDEASAWLTYEMIATCQSNKVPAEILYEDFDLAAFDFQPTGRLFAGMDIGRKKDLSVIDIEEQVGDVFWNRLSLVMPKVKFSKQEEMLWSILRKLNVERVCIDATGIGAQLAEDTVDAFGTYRAEEVAFTNLSKNDLATRTRRIFEDKLCRIALCRKLRDDLHAVKKTTTAAGNIRFDAERTKDGHADRFWAKALAFMASDVGVVKPELISLSG